MEQTYMGKLQGELDQAVASPKGIEVEFFFNQMKQICEPNAVYGQSVCDFCIKQ